MATHLALAARLRDGRADHDLLREFVQHRSQPAFAELVRRYGPLVIGVCRRTLNHTHDAEDAFQATFLVLARRAARITTPERLAGWLHSVAVRTATEIRHMRNRHQLVNPGCQAGGAVVSDAAEQHELAAALDAELAALPDHYRLPVVLCELRGLSRKLAAVQLNIAEGTLSSRLAKARKLLADRLAKRGFAAGVAAVSAALAGSASARVSEHLLGVAAGLAVQSNGEVNALESLLHLSYMDRGPWVHKTSRDDKTANRPLLRPARMLMAAQLMNLRNPQGIVTAFRRDWGEGFTREDLSVSLPLAKEVCRDEKLLARIQERKWPANHEVIVRSAVWLYLAEAGETEFLPDIAKHQGDTTRVVQYWRSTENNREYTAHVSDVSIATQLVLHGKNPADYGFLSDKMQEKRTVYRNGDGYAFPDDKTRKAAHEKALAFLKTAPVPKAKPVVPKKLDKMPEAAEELWKELHKFDEQYRHGTPEQFAELERKADELAKKFPEKDDQARIWYEVAHVAAQSDIRKHAERVRKYAPKCLELSRDPLHRAWMYSYLASAEYVADGEFAVTRRKGAEWLLTGYVELLAQELPDEKPELPAVNKIGDSDDPAARARHAAQMAAREQAVFVQDQVFRRDVLVQQLRDLYKPNKVQSNRDEKGVDELRAVAAKKLPDDAAVKALVERVMK